MRTGLRIAAAIAVCCTTRASAQRPDLVYEKSISELQAAMTSGSTSSVALVDAYLARIAAYDHGGPKLNTMIRLNPRARTEAAALDAERKAGRVRGPMHGIPVILKDNYATSDMPTSAGSIALAGLQTPFDAFQVKKLRAAGAVILGKSNMHELASGVTSISSMGGQTCNPYDPDRNPGGSSGGSGAAVAASFAAIAWGSDTCGSIRIPSAANDLFGLRPTKGLSSIDGIIPLSHTQDVGGPLARTVMDLAIGLDATVGPDPADPATKLLDGKEIPKFVASLDTTSLKGARFAIVPRLVGTTPDDQEGVRVFRAAVEKMKGRGATFVDLVLPALDTVVANGQVIEFEMKQDLIDYFARVPGAPVASLSQIIERGLFHLQLESTLRRRESLGNLQNPAYKAALDRRVVARDMVVQYLDDNRLDGLVYPTSNRKPEFTGFTQRGGNCTLSAVTGLPAISMPAGFTEDSLPIGIELVGRPLADARLLAFASDYERAVKPRRAPVTTPPLVDGKAPAPAEFVATTVAGGVSVRGTFTADASWRELKFDVRLNGTAADKVYGVTLDRDSSGTRQAVLYHLSGVGELAARGSLKLGTTERSELRAGRMAVRVFTKDKPDGSIRAPLTGTSQR